MIATILKMPVAAPKDLTCSSCGAKAEAACSCGVAYMPAAERAAAAIAQNPEKSDRAIAAEIGVGSNTVRRARSTAPHGAVDLAPAAPQAAEPAKRVGRDGRTRSLPKKPNKRIENESRAKMMIFASSALDAARAFDETRDGSRSAVTDEVRQLVTRTIRIWQQVADNIGADRG